MFSRMLVMVSEESNRRPRYNCCLHAKLDVGPSQLPIPRFKLDSLVLVDL